MSDSTVDRLRQELERYEELHMSKAQQEELKAWLDCLDDKYGYPEPDD